MGERSDSKLPSSLKAFWSYLLSSRPSTSPTISVRDFFLAFIGTIEGKTWLVLNAVTVLAIVDLLLGIGIFPLRLREKPDTTLVMLLLAPLIIFFVLIRLGTGVDGGPKIREIYHAILLIFFYTMLYFDIGIHI